MSDTNTEKNSIIKKHIILVTTLKTGNTETYSTLSDVFHDYPLLKDWKVGRCLRSSDKCYQDANIKIERKLIKRR
jgi:hypothetical protein